MNPETIPPQAVSWSDAEPILRARGVKGEDTYEDFFEAFRQWEIRHGFKTQNFNGYSGKGDPS